MPVPKNQQILNCFGESEQCTGIYVFYLILAAIQRSAVIELGVLHHLISIYSIHCWQIAPKIMQ